MLSARQQVGPAGCGYLFPDGGVEVHTLLKLVSVPVVLRGFREQIGRFRRHIEPMENPAETKWMADGNCANKAPSVFFPSDGVGVEKAKLVCEGCPVTDQCLEYAIAHRIDHGVWGGTSERQRRRIIRASAQERAANAQQPALQAN